MADKDFDHVSHGLFPCADAAGRFPVSLAFGGLFITKLALIGGVHSQNYMVLAPMKSLDIGVKPGVILLHESFGRWPSWCGWYLLQRNAFALPWGEACCLFLLRF